MNKQIIERATFIEMCACGLHGHLRFPDGDLSYEFFSKDEAAEIISASLEEKHIQEDEAEFLLSETYKLKFFAERMLPQLHAAMETLKKTEHPQEVFEKIISELYAVADELYEAYGDHEEQPQENVEEESRHTLH